MNDTQGERKTRQEAGGPWEKKERIEKKFGIGPLMLQDQIRSDALYGGIVTWIWRSRCRDLMEGAVPHSMRCIEFSTARGPRSIRQRTTDKG